MKPKKSALEELLNVMRRLRSPRGCPWDREQTHQSLRFHAVEEVYELIDAIDAGDDHEMLEELGDLLLQIIFHCQLAKERGAFDFEQVCRVLVDKLVRRHPHVFGTVKVKDVDQVWANWEQIKRAEKQGTRHERPSAFDGLPKHLPALLRAEKLVKKARKAGLIMENGAASGVKRPQRQASKAAMAAALFDLAAQAQSRGWAAEEMLRAETAKRERAWRQSERHQKT